MQVVHSYKYRYQYVLLYSTLTGCVSHAAARIVQPRSSGHGQLNAVLPHLLPRRPVPPAGARNPRGPGGLRLQAPPPGGIQQPDSAHPGPHHQPAQQADVYGQFQCIPDKCQGLLVCQVIQNKNTVKILALKVVGTFYMTEPPKGIK